MVDVIFPAADGNRNLIYPKMISATIPRKTQQKTKDDCRLIELNYFSKANQVLDQPVHFEVPKQIIAERGRQCQFALMLLLTGLNSGKIHYTCFKIRISSNFPR